MERGSSGHASWSITQALWLSVCALTAVAYVGCGGKGLFGSSSQIGGTVVVGTDVGGSVTPTSTVVPNAMVWLEQQSRSVAQGSGTVAVENLIQTTTTDSSGKFQFGIVPQGTYEIVADTASMPTTGTPPSDATISTAVQVTSSGGPGNLMIPLVAEGGTLVQGLFSTAGLSSATISYVGVQLFTGSSGTVQALIPILNMSGIPSTPTGLNPGTNCTGALPCPFGTLCACYLIELPASNPVIGVANSSGSGYSGPPSFPLGFIQPSYSIDAGAALGSTADCSPSEWVTAPFTAGSGGPTTAPEIDFTGCQ